MVKEVNIFRLQVLTRTHSTSLLSAFQKHSKGFAVRTHSNQTGPVYLGLGVLLITLSFLFIWYFIPFCGKQRKNCFLYFSWSFSPKMRLYLHFWLQFVSKKRPSILLQYFLPMTFVFPVIISSSELWPTEIQIADSKDSASKKKKKKTASEASWNGFTLSVLNLHYPLMLFLIEI